MTESQNAFPPSADTIEHAILENQLLKWWLSQRNSFTELQGLIANFEAYGRKQALEDALAIVQNENKVGDMEFEIKELIK